MPTDWKKFTQRPYIKSLSIEEQIRLFNIANESSIKLRESKYQDFANTPSTSQGAAGDGDTGIIPFTNNYSLNLDGSDDRAIASSELSNWAISGLKTTTLSFWAKIPTTTTANPAYLFTPGSGSNTGNGGFYITYRVYSGALQHFRLLGQGPNNSGGALTGGYKAADTADITLGEWFHCAMFIDLNETYSQGGKIFINGEYSNSGQFRFGNYFSTLWPVTGSASLGNISTVFAGPIDIDNISLWDTNLSSSANIATLYNGGTPGDLSNLNPVHWWTFEEGSGVTAIDHGSAANNLNIDGATYSTDVPV